jgi:hypothetical protein
VGFASLSATIARTNTLTGNFDETDESCMDYATIMQYADSNPFSLIT